MHSAPYDYKHLPYSGDHVNGNDDLQRERRDRRGLAVLDDTRMSASFIEAAAPGIDADSEAATQTKRGTMYIYTARVILMLLFVGVSGLVSGCATIVHLGGTEELNVISEPSGAKVVVDGTERGVTPIALKVERKQAHRILVSKEGYEESQTSVDSKLSLWMAGNVLFGGIIGFLVDVLSGGGYTIDPDKVAVTLQASSTIPAAVPGSVSSLHPSPPIP